ncbi:hypothetical protein J5N97_022482 [Dioscorea zingiberensis]|uniref:WAT1-related protein n=1 Tax=Dioscorea zingiberensis TaxID=325984 RepID=A0A9D5CBA3_9LILI|nr:hypothetical protein J5N97_022482 [Dioscorea zingiberensis]
MDNIKLYLTVFIIRAQYSGLQILSKATFDGGMSTAVFVFYRQALATIFLAPITFFLERKTAPPLQFKICFKMFLLALVGITLTMNIHTVALDYTTPTLSSAASNSIPAITFILSVILGMESIKLRKQSGIAKITGVALSLAGVVMIACYIGPYIKSLNHHHLLGHGNNHSIGGHVNSNKKIWVLGTSLMTIGNITWSLWLVLQGPLLKQYPSKLIFTALQCFFSTIQSFCIALVMERDFSKWKLSSEISLVSIVYCGIIVTGVSFYLQSWCVEKKGPVFFAMSTPLTLLITITFSSLFLGELVNLGSVLGGVIMIGGLYSVLWGQCKEMKDSRIPVAEETKTACFNETQMVNSQN